MTKDKLPSAVTKQSNMDKFTNPGTIASGPAAVYGPTPNIAALLAAITQFRYMVDVKIGAVGSETILLRQDLWNAVDRITEAGTRVEDSMSALQQKFNNLAVKAKELAALMEDVEGRAHWNNLRWPIHGQVSDAVLLLHNAHRLSLNMLCHGTRPQCPGESSGGEPEG
ncbi:hypothetical protein NDU88_002001 [Pleurodeles waltl]|uniref:Uncharacterized protein n=1 Tax=Pleurodeles waltl TaxID=8319 RepID=A0AAV7WP27_PLEWA|nr:hypothetical protein NDU88_002001 [Pleurodeles waltl]